VQVIPHEAVRRIFNALLRCGETNLIEDERDHGWILEDLPTLMCAERQEIPM
jgi:hypothetical protein